MIATMGIWKVFQVLFPSSRLPLQADPIEPEWSWISSAEVPEHIAITDLHLAV